MLAMKSYLLVFTIFMPLAMASELDRKILDLASRFGLTPLDPIQDEAPELTKLGGELFKDSVLSGSQAISCQTCHHPDYGTGDGLPLSIGTGGEGIGPNRLQNGAGVTRRHAQHLWNKGHEAHTHMFWDGRVGLSYRGGLKTPEPKLNGQEPERADIAKLIKTPLEAQALFPIADEKEMFGENPNNLDNFGKWKTISRRVFRKPHYKEQFKKLFKVNALNFNIGYVAQALAQFQKIRFQATDTAWDRYLKGQENALSLDQKKGALIFMTKGFCVACHSGPLLGGVSFQSSAAPQITPLNGKEDFGRYELTRMETQKFKFKIPALRNVALTSPYFHSGAFETLEQVVDHYNDPFTSLPRFSVSQSLANYSTNYVIRFQEMETQSLQERLTRLPRFYQMNRGLHLTQEEKDQLVDFLRNGLTSK